jgi:hypothetical protein
MAGSGERGGCIASILRAGNPGGISHVSRKRKSTATPPAIPRESAPSERWFRSFSILALVGILLFILVVRIRLLDIPFERDEGGFAYMGRMMLQGVPL